jgi:hypothetical protein
VWPEKACWTLSLRLRRRRLSPGRSAPPDAPRARQFLPHPGRVPAVARGHEIACLLAACAPCRRHVRFTCDVVLILGRCLVLTCRRTRHKSHDDSSGTVMMFAPTPLSTRARSWRATWPRRACVVALVEYL